MKNDAPTDSSPGDLPGIWRQRAEFLSTFGDPNSGRLWAFAATELDQALRVLGEDTGDPRGGPEAVVSQNHVAGQATEEISGHGVGRPALLSSSTRTPSLSLRLQAVLRAPPSAPAPQTNTTWRSGFVIGP